MTFLSAANYVRFQRIFAQIRAQKEQKQAVLCKVNRGLKLWNNDKQSASVGPYWERQAEGV